MLPPVRTWGLLALAVAALVALAAWAGCEATRSEQAPDRPTDASPDTAQEPPDDADVAPVQRTERASRHPDSPPTRRTCVLNVLVETTGGAPIEAACVSAAGLIDHTDRAGRVSLPDVPRGRRCTVTLEFQSHKNEEHTRELDIPADAAEHEVVFRVDPPLWPVLVIRLTSDVPREAAASVHCRGGANYSFSGIRPEMRAFRVPVSPPGIEAIEVHAECPGFESVATQIEAPRTPGEHPLELTLRSGGLPAWGRVLEDDGTPAEGAKVVARRGDVPVWLSPEVTSGPDGRFRIVNMMRGTSIVALREGKECSPPLELTGDVRTIELQLGRGASAEGRVTFADGSPAPGADVRLCFTPSGSLARQWSAITDDRGVYRFSGIPEGWWIRPALMWKNDFGPGDDASGPFGSGTTDELVQSGEAHIAGPARDVFRRDLRAQKFESNLECELRLRLPPGADVPTSVVVEEWTETGGSASQRFIESEALCVTVSLRAGRRTIVRVTAGPLHADTGWFVPERGSKPPVFELDLKSVPRILAQLVDDAGAPVRRADVDILVGYWRGPTGSGTQKAATDDSGRADVTSCIPPVAVLEVPDRAVAFAMQGPGVLRRFELGEHPNLRIEGPDLARRLRAGEDDVVLPIPIVPPRRIVVQTVDDAGRPVGGVTLESDDTDVLEPATVTTDRDGRAEFSLLLDFADHLNSTGRIKAANPFRGEASREVREFEKRLDEPWIVTVTQLVRQRVRIVDDEGAAVAGVTLNGDEECVTNAAGEALVLVSAPGDSIEVPGYATAVVKPSPDGATVQIRVSALRTVHLHVTIPQDAPVNYTVTSSRAGAGVVGSESVMLLQRPIADLPLSLTRAAHTVEIVSQDRLWHATAHVAAGAESASATLERRPLRVVRVRFVDAAGTALAHARVAIALTGPPSFDAREEPADASGEIRLELPDGAYGLRHGKPGQPLSEPQPFTVPADAPVIVRM